MPHTDILGREWTAEDERTRARVVECLHDKGARYGSIGLAEQEMTRGLADGFGPLDPTADDYRQMLWDWSHVRDSSPAGFQRMFNYLEALGAV